MVMGVRVCPKCKSIYAEDIRFCGIDGEKLVDQDADPLIGHTLGKYEILRRLGAGAMGVVYRARHSVLETEFAVKVLYGEHGANETVTKRFRREAQAVSKIKHPNVVSIVDFGVEDEGLSYLVMELVEGPTLQELIRAEAPFELARAKLISRHIAEGLAEAHHHGFVHRDLKPGNVIVNQKRRGELAKILDFGLVTITDSESSQTRLTKTGHTVGTPAYMAPEQTRSSKVQPTADLYSLGVIIFEMLTGNLPFDGETSDVLIRKCLEPAPSLEKFGHLGVLTNALVERDPSARPQTAQETVQFIDELLDQAGVSTSGFHNSPLSSSSAIARKNSSSSAIPGSSLQSSVPLDETTAQVATPALSFSDVDALARTSPSRLAANASSDDSAQILAAQASGGTRKLLPALLAIAVSLVAGIIFFSLPDEVSVPVATTAITLPKEASPPPSKINNKAEVAVVNNGTGEVGKREVKAPNPAISTEQKTTAQDAPLKNEAKESEPLPEVKAQDDKKAALAVGQPSASKSVAVKPKPVPNKRNTRSSKRKRPAPVVRKKAPPPKPAKPTPKVAEVPPKPPVVAAKPKPMMPEPMMPAPKPGTLKIRGLTWWDVHVDGQKKYRHPSKPRVFEAGKYVIELHNFNCANSPIRKTITISAGQKVQLRPKCDAQ